MASTNKRAFTTIKSYLVEVIFKFDENSMIVLHTLVRSYSPRDCLVFMLNETLQFLGNRTIHFTTGKLVYNYRFHKIYAYSNEGKLVGIYNITEFKDLARHISKVEILEEYDATDNIPDNLSDQDYPDPGLCTVRYKEDTYAI